MSASPRPRFAELVFATRRLESPRRWAMALVVAVAAYLFLWSLVVLVARPSLASWATEVAMEVHARMDRQRQMNATLEVTPPPAPPPAALPPPAAEAPPPPQAPKPSPAKGASLVKAAPASPEPPQAEAPVEAADVVAVPANESATSDNTIVKGQAEQVASGLASAQGVAASETTKGDRLGSSSGTGTAALGVAPALRQPVRLADEDWACPWPAEADDAPIEEAEVVIRALVDAQGRLLRVQVDKDPGLGFAQAAKLCARGVRFSPALGSDGRPAQAWSPRIRVRFLR